jgi:hypothetical protein
MRLVLAAVIGGALATCAVALTAPPAPGQAGGSLPDRAEAIDATTTALLDAHARRVASDTVLAARRQEAVEIAATAETEIAAATGIADAATAAEARARVAWVDLTVAAYIAPPGGDLTAALATPGAADQRFRADELADILTEVTNERHVATAAASDDADASLATTVEVQTAARLAAEAAEDAALADQQLAMLDLGIRTQERTEAVESMLAVRDRSNLPGTDIPWRLLSIYRQAADKRFQTDPACDAQWWMMAAITRTESTHARYGAGMAANGDLPTILGPPLDGQNGFVLIPDTDGGALDGSGRQRRRGRQPQQPLRRHVLDVELPVPQPGRGGVDRLGGLAPGAVGVQPQRAVPGEGHGLRRRLPRGGRALAPAARTPQHR